MKNIETITHEENHTFKYISLKLSKLPENIKNPHIIKQMFIHNNKETRDKIKDHLPNIKIKWNAVKEIIITAKVTCDTKEYQINIETNQRNYHVLTKESYDDLSNVQYIGMIVKIRYDLSHDIDPIDPFTIHIDNYILGLKGLIIAEIKYKDKDEEYPDFIKKCIEKYFGNDYENISSCQKYNNKNLALLNNIVLSKC